MKKEKTIQERAEAFVKEENSLIEKYNLDRQILFTFPGKKKVPFFGKVSVRFLKWSGGIIEFQFNDKK
jgi:hypothetical protein